MKLTYLRAVKAIAFDGAYLSVVDDEGTTHTVTVDPGPVDLTTYAPLTTLGEVELVGFLVHASTGSRGVLFSPARHDSAASETYVPSLAEKQEALMRNMVSGMVKQQLKREREKAAANVSRIIETPPPTPKEEVAPDEPTVADKGDPDTDRDKSVADEK